jgi:haloalkane dehalogenase
LNEIPLRQFFMKKHLFSFFTGLVLAASLTGCTTPLDTQPIYAAHVAAFAKSQPHNTLKVSRSDGFKIAVREFGAANQRRGPTVVMLHGFPDNQHLYDLLIPELTATHHVISFDFLGWGDSDKPAGHLYDVASQRADLDAVVKHFALQQVVVVVHDLSGHSGIDWALDNEAQTAGLVLLNTYYQNMPTLIAPEAIQTYSTPGWFRDLAVWGSGKSTARFKAGVGSQLRSFFSNPARRDAMIPVITHTASDIRPAFISSTSVLWPEIAVRDKNVPRVQAFKKPVWVIFGADDPYLNKGVATEFARVFPNSSLSLLEQAGHYVQLDRGDEVGRILREKLAVR